VENRSIPLLFWLNVECTLYLRKWVERDNLLKRNMAEIQAKCAEFEGQLITTITDVGRTYTNLVNEEFRSTEESLSEIGGKSQSKLY
jgi:hypothetical protein